MVAVDKGKACKTQVYTVELPLYERLKETMKQLKETKARKPKPHSLGGRRAAVAKAARRATPATRGENSRAKWRRNVTAKAAAEASAAARLGKIGKRRVQSEGPMGRIDAELPDPLALPP